MENVIKILENERECVKRQVNGMCDNKRDCPKCDLAGYSDSEIVNAYDVAIRHLRRWVEYKNSEEKQKVMKQHRVQAMVESTDEVEPLVAVAFAKEVVSTLRRDGMRGIVTAVSVSKEPISKRLRADVTTIDAGGREYKHFILKTD